MTGVAARAWIMVAGAVLSGSSREPPIDENTRKAAGFPAVFSPLCYADVAGEYPAGLLDIGESLC